MLYFILPISLSLSAHFFPYYHDKVALSLFAVIFSSPFLFVKCTTGSSLNVNKAKRTIEYGVLVRFSSSSSFQHISLHVFSLFMLFSLSSSTSSFVIYRCHFLFACSCRYFLRDVFSFGLLCSSRYSL